MSFIGQFPALVDGWHWSVTLLIDCVLGGFSFQVLFAIKSLHFSDQIRVAICTQRLSELLSSHKWEHRWVSSRQRWSLSFHLRALYFGGVGWGATFWFLSPDSFTHCWFIPEVFLLLGECPGLAGSSIPGSPSLKIFSPFPDSGACKHSDPALLL